MQYDPFYILSSSANENQDNWFVSFEKFTDFLEDKISTEGDSLKAKFYRFVLKHFKKHPEILRPVHVKDLADHKLLLNLLEGIVLSHLYDENNTLLALSTPVNDVFFYCTKAFHNLMSPANDKSMYSSATEEERETFYKTLLQAKYALILERLYHAQPYVPRGIVYAWKHKEMGLDQYYNISIDNRFVDVKCISELPGINSARILAQLENAQDIQKLTEILPLKNFRFTGFSIATATDITSSYALHKMRSAIIRNEPQNLDHTYHTILNLLKTLCGAPSIEFGLLPFLKLNDRLVSYYQNYRHSILINIGRDIAMTEEDFTAWINQYFKNPQKIFTKNCALTVNSKDDLVYKAFQKSGYIGYSLLPVYYNNEVTGLLEISTLDNSELNEALLTKLDTAMAILGQLLHNNQAIFTADINEIIAINFTAVQHSVLWKFNEVAWGYLKNDRDKAIKDIADIRFESVFPLYGAIDIRNSTVERNNALHKDMQYYFSFIRELLDVIRNEDSRGADDLESEAEASQQQVNELFSGNEEAILDDFITKVGVYLKAFVQKHAAYSKMVDGYFASMHPDSGQAYTHRRALENAIQSINHIINQQLETAEPTLRERYPIYFEKFRTDGIEYDIYLGQSISPNQYYREDQISELRLWQLRNMIEIIRTVRANHSIHLPHLHTTQLIYVNASAIDISFRMDEKHFDVEGSYNIRYHIIKKRIDKAFIRNTTERLTQPNKIAVVYSQHRHKEEYLGYVHLLQEEKLLAKNVETVELEELQGVTGLKAIRVEVV